jgi:hypothetical protein
LRSLCFFTLRVCIAPLTVAVEKNREKVTAAVRRMLTNRMNFLQISVSHDLVNDTVMIPADVWTDLEKKRRNSALEPLWIRLDLQGVAVVGRAVPATPSDRLGADMCRMPVWMGQLFGVDDAECASDIWISVEIVVPPVAGRIVLRARRESDVLAMDDPVSSLTAALMGTANGKGWSCLNAGAELPLACGTFDVMEVWSIDETQVETVSLIDTDVAVEFVPAADHMPPAPVPSPVPAPSPSPTPSPAMLYPTNQKYAGHPKGFIPFSGVGRRLRD